MRGRVFFVSNHPVRGRDEFHQLVEWQRGPLVPLEDMDFGGLLLGGGGPMVAHLLHRHTELRGIGEKSRGGRGRGGGGSGHRYALLQPVRRGRRGAGDDQTSRALLITEELLPPEEL
jgi:hypothetical protein